MQTSLHSATKPLHSRNSTKRKRVFAASLPSRVASVETMIHKALAALGRCGCHDGIRTDIEIALREALHNAVVHGNGRDPRKRVRVECFEQPDKSLVVVVRDNGRGFNPSRVDDPTKPENLYRETGRGIYMIRHFMDEVKFKRGGREIHMRKKR